MFTHVKLHARAERRYADADRERDVKAELQRAGFGPGLIDAQLKNLEKAVDASWSGAPSGRRGRTTATAPTTTHDDLRAKERFVTAAVESPSRPGACSTSAPTTAGSPGSPSQAGAASVVAVDSDDLVVDRLYRDLRRDGERRILPLVVDLSDPSPGLGWRSRERPPFVERVRPDLVLCLAVVHHLALTNTVPLDEIVAFLADFARPLVVEFPHRDDVMAPGCSPASAPACSTPTTASTGSRRWPRRFAVAASETIGTRTLYRCDPT